MNFCLKCVIWFSASAHFLPCPFSLTYLIIHKSCSESFTLVWVGSQSPLTTQSLSNRWPRNKTWHLTDCSFDRQLFSSKGKTKSVPVKTGWFYWIIRVLPQDTLLNLTYANCCPSGGFSEETWLRGTRFNLSLWHIWNLPNSLKKIY